jgi:hypothetical protein
MFMCVCVCVFNSIVGVCMWKFVCCICTNVCVCVCAFDSVKRTCECEHNINRNTSERTSSDV